MTEEPPIKIISNSGGTEMDFTSINEISKSYLGNFYSQNIVAGKNNPVSFQAVLDVNMGGLEDRLKVQYPNLKYHVLDTSKINSSLWQRNDYPFEMFFEDKLDESVLDWKPTSREPAMLDAGVQERLNAARGKYAIVVPTALEKKLENNPELSQSIMDKISTLIKEQDSVPSSIDSFNITLDDKGNISNYRFSGGGGEITITKRNGQKNKDGETEEIKEQERYQRLAAKRALQRKEQLEKAKEQRKLAQANYLNHQLASQQRLQSLFMEKMQSEQGTVNMSAVQSASVSASAVSAYEDTISTFSKNVIESQKL